MVDDAVRMGFSLGTAEYLTKPVDREHLLEVARELSGEKREFLQAHTDHVLRKGEAAAENLLPLVRRILADHRQGDDGI